MISLTDYDSGPGTMDDHDDYGMQLCMVYS